MDGVRRDLAARLASGGQDAPAPPPGPEGGGPPEPAPPASGLWRVQAGAFARKENAEALAEKLRAAGFEAWVVPPVRTC
ncbi:MAG: SPOR domain-containing protein [Bacillota bacterium]|nr:SPOR domain-containing protein [Bacillota bacterium]